MDSFFVIVVVCFVFVFNAYKDAFLFSCFVWVMHNSVLTVDFLSICLGYH